MKRYDYDAIKHDELWDKYRTFYKPLNGYYDRYGGAAFRTGELLVHHTPTRYTHPNTCGGLNQYLSSATGLELYDAEGTKVPKAQLTSGGGAMRLLVDEHSSGAGGVVQSVSHRWNLGTRTVGTASPAELLDPDALNSSLPTLLTRYWFVGGFTRPDAKYPVGVPIVQRIPQRAGRKPYMEWVREAHKAVMAHKALMEDAYPTVSYYVGHYASIHAPLLRGVVTLETTQTEDPHQWVARAVREAKNNSSFPAAKELMAIEHYAKKDQKLPIKEVVHIRLYTHPNARGGDE